LKNIFENQRLIIIKIQKIIIQKRVFYILGEKEYQQGMMQVPGVSPYRFWLSSSFMLC
jgi:hypothetical protein